MGSAFHQRHRFRELLASSELVMAPGAGDAIFSRLIEQAGFPAVYVTGAGTSLARGFAILGTFDASAGV